MRLATAKALIQFAYNVRAFQVSGGPSWIGSDRFDIDAKADDVTVGKMQAMTFDQRLALRRLMYQSLLAERFKLKVRFRTTTEAPVYSLIVAKPGGKSRWHRTIARRHLRQYRRIRCVAAVKFGVAT